MIEVFFDTISEEFNWELSISKMADHSKKISNLKKHMKEKLMHAVDGIKFNGQSSDLNNSLNTVLNVSIPYMNDQHMFLFNLDINNIFSQ